MDYWCSDVLELEDFMLESPEFSTLAHEAASAGCMTALRLLLAVQPASVAASTGDSQLPLPLQRAVQAGRTDAVRLLLPCRPTA